MSLTQLNPPLPIETPKGPGLAHAVIDYGPEADLFWCVFLDSGEIWTYHNRECRAQKNVTMGGVIETKDKEPEQPENNGPKPDEPATVEGWMKDSRWNRYWSLQYNPAYVCPWRVISPQYPPATPIYCADNSLDAVRFACTKK